MFDMYICYELNKNMFSSIEDMINCINNKCDSICFDRIPLLYKYNSISHNYEVYTTREYNKALEFCLKDIYWN